MHAILHYEQFVLTVLLFLLIPGAGTLTILTASAQGGVRSGLKSLAGIVLGDQMLLWMAVLGVAAAMQQTPKLYNGLRYAGALYLVFLGGQMLWTTFKKHPHDGLKADEAQKAQGQSMPHRRYFQRGLTITLLNPKAILFYVAFLPQFIEAKAQFSLQMQGFVVLAATIVIMGALYGALLVFLTLKTQGLLSNKPQIQRRLAQFTGFSLVVLGLRMAFNA